MKKQFKIGNKIVNEESKTFIIAEAGVNHNGDINLAKKLILEAKKAGADCIKFQTFKSDKLVTKHAQKAKYQRQSTGVSDAQYKMLKSLELSKEDFNHLNKYCKKNNIIFLSTPYNFDDVDFLEKIGSKAFKLASMHLTENEFIKYVAKKDKAFLISTGMSNQLEIDEVYKLLKKQKNQNFCILQCTTNYPIKDNEANLNVIKTFIKNYNCIIGYSDHTEDYLACIAAVALGAKIIEKHFTLDKKLRGPDHSSSINPKEFKKMVEDIRRTEVILGSKIKKKNKIEKDNEKFMKRGIVARKDLKKGSIITNKNIDFMRPFTGIKPNDFVKIIGKRVKRDVKKSERIYFKILK